MLHRETLSTLLTLIVAVVLALALIALQPQPAAAPRAASAVGAPAGPIEPGGIEPMCAGAAPAHGVVMPCAAPRSKS